MATGDARMYLATAQAFDDEMRAKIAAHVAQRGAGWTTLEIPLDAADALDGLQAGRVCLLDCATLWLSNHLLADHDLDAQSDRLLGALQSCAARVVVVTNEVGSGVVPDTSLGRQFRTAQGRLNIRLAARADLVVQVVAGLPNVLKGHLP